MAVHTVIPARTSGRSRRTLASLLATALLLGVTALGVVSAGAAAFTGYYAPRIADGGVDVNNDGQINGYDTSISFMGATDLLDGHLDCDGWTATNNFAGGGNGSIGPDDDCVLQGYAISTGLVSTETFLFVQDGAFLFQSTAETGAQLSPIPNGSRMPGAYASGTSFNYGTTCVDPCKDRADADWAWRLVGGKVDWNYDNTIDVTDDVAGYLTVYLGPVDIIAVTTTHGWVDLDGSGTISAADTCTYGCFFGQNVTSGVVQDNTPVDPYAAGTGPQGSPGPAGVSGRTVVSSTSTSNSLDKGVTATCPAGKVVIGGGYRLSSPTAANLKSLVVTRNVASAADTWTARAVEGSPVAGNWSITATAICATAS